MAGIFVTHFCAGHLHKGRAVSPFPPSPQPKGVSFAPDCLLSACFE